MLKIEKDLESVKNPIIIDVANELISRGKKDPSLQTSHNKKNKSLEGLWRYLSSEMKKRAVEGAAVAPREEIYGMAQHYYDEDSIGETKKAKVKALEVDAKEKEIILPEETMDDFDL